MNWGQLGPRRAAAFDNGSCTRIKPAIQICFYFSPDWSRSPAIWHSIQANLDAKLLLFIHYQWIVFISLIFENPISQLWDFIETWFFCEDLKPIALHHKDDDDDDDDDDDNDNDDNNNNKKFKFNFLSVGTW